ncbi:MAG: hypothetical protein QOI13_3389 [Paraburkholderia sp.]|nr:hypothetical protein [Paraburkholderia sp.]
MCDNPRGLSRYLGNDGLSFARQFVERVHCPPGVRKRCSGVHRHCYSKRFRNLCLRDTEADGLFDVVRNTAVAPGPVLPFDEYIR